MRRSACFSRLECESQLHLLRPRPKFQTVIHLSPFARMCRLRSDACRSCSVSALSCFTTSTYFVIALVLFPHRDTRDLHLLGHIRFRDSKQTLRSARSTKHRHRNDDQHPSLLELPPELWSYICALAVIEDSWIHAWDSDSTAAVAQAFGQPPITRVCRTLRAETVPAFYARNVFCVSVPTHEIGVVYVDALGRWIDMLMQTGSRRHVSELRIRVPYSGSLTCLRLERWLNAWRCGEADVDVSLVEQTVKSVLHESGEVWRTYEIRISPLEE